MTVVACTLERHGPAVLEMINEAIVNSTALYEYHPWSEQRIAEWFAARAAAGFPVIGMEDEAGRLQAFASYGSFRAYPAFKYAVEHSIYVHREFRQMGIGLALMRALIARAREQGFHVLVGAIDLSNEASVALHERVGFTHAGTVKEAGFKFGRWLDLALFQLILDTPATPVED
jgi:phosphinothricin acetyltransferase